MLSPRAFTLNKDAARELKLKLELRREGSLARVGKVRTGRGVGDVMGVVAVKG